ncbi:SgcJ/EcaC family oxidoreductase [Streptomyces sp. FIT100]|uniref:SgcJ/EcaC family oxidoreductase n=1 Tax=Streptomyces sp. FIT100 TaxID=2837956 RepID=UPI0021C89D51|nr:SgcJ/EcaC family oxidoreductase [Streptomyces sp. FIT100]UUN30062.1 SgcJ/EcaC family oxidoreductase [Streptomyces sp. FIT100]
MKTSRPARRGLLLATPVAVALAVTGCSSSGGTDPDTTQKTTSAARADGTLSAPDETSIRRLFDQMNKAWERGDAKAYAATHTADADLVDFRGTHAVGREGIMDLLQPAFDGPLKGTRVEATIKDLRLLSPTVAVMHTEGKIVPTGGESLQTFVVEKEAGGWKFAAFQNTRIQGQP